MHDPAHDATELILRETEADVSRVYRQAADEMQKKLEDYWRRYDMKDRVKREHLRKGEITKQEYLEWRKGQLMIGQRWEEMLDTLSRDMHNSNNIARSIVVKHMPEVYAINHNYATFQIEKGSLLDTSYTLYDRSTVERIIRDQPELLPPPGKDLQKRIAANKDIAWQRGKIQSVTLQSILQGESIPKMAKRIAKTMGETNNAATVRYARTAMTGAQNAGRVDAYRRAEGMGIEMEQEWLATLDNRTRYSHRHMDGQHVKVGEKFSNGCRFPGDPDGPGYEVWNCRCTLVPRVKGVDQSNAPRNSNLGSMSYDEWEGKEEGKQSSVQREHEKQVDFDYKRFDSDLRAVEYSIDEWSEWRSGLTQSEIASLEDYASSSNDVNGYLRGKDIPSYKISKVRQQISNIDSAIERGEIHEPLTVYRGVGSSYLGVDLSSEEAVKRAVGSSITDPGYMSTSLSRGVSEDYRHGNGVIIEMKVPSGTHAAYVDIVRDTAEELIEFAEDGDAGNIEYLLERGGTMNIIGYEWATDGGGKKYIKVLAEYMRL